MKRFALPMLAALGAAFATVAPAGADDPMPTPCAGVFATDKAGDQEIGPIIGGPPGGPTNTKAPDNMDIRSVFFNTVDGVTTANIEVTKLDKTVPPELREGRFSYVVDFGTVGDITFVRAEVSSSAVTYHAATVTTLPNGTSQITGQKDLKGKFLEGPNGIVQIEMPADVFKPGVKLENAFAVVTQRTDNNNYVGYLNDSAPDTGATAAKSHVITECPAPEPSATPEPTPQAPPADPNPQAPPQTTPANTEPTQPQPAQQQPQQQPAQPAKKPAKKKKASCSQKAKKKFKGKKNAKKRKAALKKCKKAKKRR